MLIMDVVRSACNWLRQFLSNGKAKVEFSGMIEASIVRNDLKRLETSMNRRLDMIESYTDDVIEKYLRKISARENRERKGLIEETPQIQVDPYSEILKKYGRE